MKRFMPLFVLGLLYLPSLTHQPTIERIRSPANASKRGFLTRIEGFIGGVNRCQSFTAQEIGVLSNKIKRAKGLDPGASEAQLEDTFFQEMTQRSHAATTCQLGFISSYFNDKSIESTMNENGWKVLQSFHPVLNKMITTRNEKYSMAENIRMGHDPMDKSYAQAVLDMKGAELRYEASQLDQAINSIIAQIPLGSHIIVRDAMRKLALEKDLREPDFIESYSESLEILRPKLQKAKEYFDDKLKKDGTFKISRSDKIAFMRSGRASILLNEVDPEGTRLACRLKALYSTGPATTQMVAMFGLLAASIATDGVAGFLVGLGMTGTMIADIQRECFKPTMSISGESSLTCDPSQMVATSVTEASMVSCGISVGLVALPALKTFASELKTGVKTFQKSNSVSLKTAVSLEKPVIPKVSPKNTAELKAIQTELGTCIESLPKDIQKRLRIKFHNQSEEKTLKDLRDMRDLRRINGACK